MPGSAETNWVWACIFQLLGLPATTVSVGLIGPQGTRDGGYSAVPDEPKLKHPAPRHSRQALAQPAASGAAAQAEAPLVSKKAR